MNDVKRRESGASEVIGAVLLVSLVVIGGAIIAAYVFGQPAPKEVPHVNFGVSLDNKSQNLTLHHTGGDTLLPGEYHVTVYDTYGVPHTPAIPSDTSIEWSADEDMNITKVTYAVGDVVLSFIDRAGGETVLRRVPFEDHSLRGIISGHKYNVTGGQRVPWKATDPRVTINIYRKEGSTYTGVYSREVDAHGQYSYTLPIDVWGVYKVEEVGPDGFESVSPPHGSKQVDLSTSSPVQQVDFENRLLPVVTTRTTKPTETITITPSPTPTPTPVPTNYISGTKYQVDENNAVIGGVGGIDIKIKLISPSTLLPVLQAEPFLFSNQGEKTITTATDGSYSFLVPDVPATYRLSEVDGLDPKIWWIQSDAEGEADGIINGVAPGATGQNFYNYRVPTNGVVMYLDKLVNESCPGGYVVDGTTLEGEARGSDFVNFTIGGKEQTYRFQNGEQFRFTIRGDQDRGEVMIDDFEMTSLTFNVKFEVRRNRNTQWTTPTTRQFNPTGADVIGPTTDISIDAINKNLLNENSTLAYRHPICSDNKTLLRLNGEIRIDANPDHTYLEFANLHEVHDNRYGEGLNTMWIYLMPDRDYILAQGVCVYP